MKPKSINKNFEPSKKNIKVFFAPSGKQGLVDSNQTVLQIARSLGVDIDSVCGGRAMCGRCQIEVSEGEFAKHGISSKSENLSKRTHSEKRYSEKRNLNVSRRLSCQARINEDVVIDVPPESQVHRQVIRKAIDDREVIIDPVINLYFVEVREPSMHDPSGDFQRLIEALKLQWNLSTKDEISTDLKVLQKLQTVLRMGKWSVTVALRDGKRVVDVWPGLKERIYGAAVDVGSTTISVHIVDLHSGLTISSSGGMNPQIRYGEDLMSRVSYVMMNEKGDKDLSKIVQEGIENLIKEAAETASINFQDVLEIVFVGNPVMHHLLLGINPTELGGAPFALSIDSPFECLASEVNINLNSGTRLYGLPCIAGHVGADAAAATLAEEPYKNKFFSLIIDVGTNAEIILGNNKRILAASSPTGPAFEGAQITCGQRAAPGAIEKVRINSKTLEPKFCVIGTKGWLDDNRIKKDKNPIAITGICGSGIIEVLGEMYLSGILTRDGIIKGELKDKNKRIEENGRTYSYRLSDKVVITQNDVRAIQLAKAALHAGFKLLMDKMGIVSVEKVMLAGAFGSHIEPKYAMVLGMVPDCELTSISSVGNSAGAGARLALLSRNKRAEIQELVEKIEKIETAVEPKFQEHFVEAMAFPHKTNPYSKLASQINLPKFMESKNLTDKIRTRRRRNSKIN
mgnify:CR=1 FL=1